MRMLCQPVVRVMQVWTCLVAAAGLTAVTSTARGADPAPGVIRTFTHHQVTALPSGAMAFRPVLSATGNRICFGLPADATHPPGLAAVDFDGGNLVTLDNTNYLCGAAPSADGSRVAYITYSQSELRIIGGDGRDGRILVKSASLYGPRITGDGKVVAFLAARGLTIRNGDRDQDLVRGVYKINADGTNLRRVAGPDEVARLRGGRPEDVGSPNFDTGYADFTMDMSLDGRQMVFGCYDKSGWFLLGCDGEGGSLHLIAERRNPAGGGTTQAFNSIALSGDGTTVAYQYVYPNEIAVSSFGGNSEKSLLKEGREVQPLAWGSSEPIYITADGARVTYAGRHIYSDGSGWFELLHAQQDPLLGSYTPLAPDAAGRRFAYLAHLQPMQLATMEMNVALSALRGAPQISEITVDPGAIPREKPNVPASLTAARAVAVPAPDHLAGTGFVNGLIDPSLEQFGSVGMTDLRDDGKADTDGDAKAGDSIYTGRWLRAYPDAPAQLPRTIRFEAQIQDSAKLYHGQVVEVGPFAVVDGQPSAGPVTITVTPPPPLPLKPGTNLGGSSSGPGVATGTGTGTSGTGTPAGGAIDLTGYWVSESGALHFVRQIGLKVYWSVDALPKSRNIFMGTIDGDVLTGTWVDLPGGMIETGNGTLKLKIVSNDRLTKISDSPAYDAAVWTRTAKPGSSPASGGSAGAGGASGPGGAGGALAGTGPSPAAQPWQTPQGRALIDRWEAETEATLNAYDGGLPFNSRKPYHFNKYGLLEDKILHSAFAPDNFKDYGNDRYYYMWSGWVPGAGGWDRKEWNDLRIPSLRDYVLKGLAAGK